MIDSLSQKPSRHMSVTETVYDAAGDELTESSVGNRYCFQGREYDWTTHLYYFRARWYDPVSARWLSKDPIGISGGLNQYVFAGNNLVNFTDPLGLFQFGSRPLKGLPWIPFLSDNPWLDLINFEFSHEHGFFEPKGSGRLIRHQENNGK